MKKFYFTFLTCQYTDDIYLGDKYVIINAHDLMSARELMFSIFDDKWGFQYTEEEFLDGTKDALGFYYPGGCYGEYTYGNKYLKVKVVRK